MTASFLAMLNVIAIVATLTKGAKILVRAILDDFVHVGDGQHDVRHFARLLVQAIGVVLHSAELTAIVCPFEDVRPNLLPVLRVSRFILWSYRHLSLSLSFHKHRQWLCLSVQSP